MDPPTRCAHSCSARSATRTAAHAQRLVVVRRRGALPAARQRARARARASGAVQTPPQPRCGRRAARAAIDAPTPAARGSNYHARITSVVTLATPRAAVSLRHLPPRLTGPLAALNGRPRGRHGHPEGAQGRQARAAARARNARGAAQGGMRRARSALGHPWPRCTASKGHVRCWLCVWAGRWCGSAAGAPPWQRRTRICAKRAPCLPSRLCGAPSCRTPLRLCSAGGSDVWARACRAQERATQQEEATPLRAESTLRSPKIASRVSAARGCGGGWSPQGAPPGVDVCGCVLACGKERTGRFVGPCVARILTRFSVHGNPLQRDTSDLDAMMLGADGDTDELMGMPPERLLHAGEFWSPPDDLDDSNDGQ